MLSGFFYNFEWINPDFVISVFRSECHWVTPGGLLLVNYEILIDTG